VPMIFVRPLNLIDTASRANLYAIPPAAVVIASLLALAAGLLAKSNRQYRWLVWAGALPLILSGLGVQLYVQARWQDAWEGQKAIWGQVFQVVPGLADETTVVLVMQGYRSTQSGEPGFGTHPPIYAEWEFEDALKVLYSDPSLEGRIAFPRADYYSEAAFTEQGVQGANRSELTPYDRVIFLIYREAMGQLQVLENPARLLGLPFELNGYAPYARILPAEPSACQYRHLVGWQDCDGASTR